MVAWVVKKYTEVAREIEDGPNKIGTEETDKESMQKVIAEAIEYCKTRFNEVYENDVKAAFAKFDADGSGAIDREELA